MTTREVFLLQLLAVVAGIAAVVGIGFLMISSIAQLDRDIAGVQKQLQQLSKGDTNGQGSVSEQIASLTAQKQELEGHFFQKGELSIYDFAGLIRSVIASHNLTTQVLSIDAKTNEIISTCQGSLVSIVRLLRELQSGPKYRSVRYVAIQRLRESECSLQIRVGYAEIPF